MQVVPIPSKIPILKNYPEFRRDPLQFWLDAAEVSPITEIELGPFVRYWVVSDPELIEHVLKTNAKNYPRERRLIKLGSSRHELMFNTADWDEWLWRRRLMQPAFHRKQIARFAEAMVEETAGLLNEWQAGQRIVMQDEMKKLTMRIIGRTMFSADVGAQTAQLQHDFEQVSEYAYKRTSAPINWPNWFPTPLMLKTVRAERSRIRILQEIVEGRMKGKGEREKEKGEEAIDLLDMLMGARLQENGDGEQTFSAVQLVYEMAGIVFAGHETTALTLTWLFYRLSRHPEIAERVYAEIDAVLGNRLPTLEDLDALPYTEQVVLETMRFYPPVYLTIREAMEADVCGGLAIPQGQSMIVNIRGLHHDRRHWRVPHKFLPERFDPVVSNTRGKNVYIPFILGPKKCIGDAFAMMEMRLVVATILQRVRLDYVGANPAKEKAGFVMEADNGVPMVVGR